jgi:general secretion pathway protein G
VRRSIGYTIIEAMMVLGIVGIGAALSYPIYSGYTEKMEIANVKKDFVLIDLKIETYFATNGEYPPDLATIGMQKDDPWGTPYQYLNMDLADGDGQKRKDHNQVPINTDYDLYSKGPDGASSGPLTAQPSRDDIVRANNGEFIGEATDY